MTKKPNLESLVSGGIARTNPLEGGPTMEAKLAGTTFVRDTWGGYASRLLEHYGGEKTPEEVLEMLRIDSEDLKNPNIQFARRYDFGFYRDGIREKLDREIKDYLAPEQERLLIILDAIMSGYEVDDATAKMEISTVDWRLHSLEQNFNYDTESREEYDEYYSLMAEWGMKREALESGVAITAAEFVSVMLSTNITQSDTPSELAQDWIDGVGLALDRHMHDYGSEDSKVLSADRTVLGRDAFLAVRKMIDGSSLIKRYVDEGWAAILPVFTTEPLEEHTLITGELDR